MAESRMISSDDISWLPEQRDSSIRKRMPILRLYNSNLNDRSGTPQVHHSIVVVW